MLFYLEESGFTMQPPIRKWVAMFAVKAARSQSQPQLKPIGAVAPEKTHCRSKAANLDQPAHGVACRWGNILRLGDF